MEIPYRLYLWLKSKFVIVHDYKDVKGKVKLNDSDSAILELGLIIDVFPSHCGSLPTNLDLKKSNTSNSRLHNWNLLIPSLDKINIPITNDTKALLVAGEHSTILETLEQLYSYSIEKPLKIPKNLTDGTLLLSNISENSSLTDTQSLLEFLILTFCKCFKLAPRVAAGLLVQKAEYLSKVIIKGLKGDFKPVLQWYTTIENYSNHILTLSEKEIFSANLIFTCAKSGIFSQGSEVQGKAFAILRFFQNKFKIYNDLTWNWLNSDSIFTADCFRIISVKGENYENILELLFDFGKTYLNELLVKKLKDYCGKLPIYLAYISKILQELARFSQSLFNQGIIDIWVNLALREAETNWKNYDNWALCVGFLCDIWVGFPNFIEFQEDLPNNILGVIKRATRLPNNLLQIITFGRLFQLLANFSNAKYSFAPIIYKTLTFCLVENYGNEKIREFMLQNMGLILNEFHLIPPGILLEPLIKQSLISKSVEYHLFDFEFFITVAQLEKFSIKDAVILLDLLGKIFLNDYFCCRLAKIPFLIIVTRFIISRPVQEFIFRFVVVALKISFAETTRLEDFDNNKIRENCLDLIGEVANLGNQELNQNIREEFQKLVMGNYKKKVGTEKFVKVFAMVGGPYVEKLPIRSEKPGSVGGLAKNPAWYTVPRGRALSDIQKIKEKRLSIENKLKFSAERNSLSHLLTKKSLRLQLEKRIGVQSKLEEIHSSIIDSEPQIKLYQFQEELDQDQLLIQVIIKKYSRINKFLFKKYSSANNSDRILLESGFSKLIRENNIGKSILTTEEIKKVYMFLVARLKTTGIFLEYFAELLYLLASFVFSRPPHDFSNLPPAWGFDCLYSLFFANSPNISSLLFEDAGYGDRDVVNTLNLQLEKNSEISLPVGYIKVNQPYLKLEYKACAVEKSQKIAVEILDNIIAQTFSFHFLMPTVSKSFQVRAKGVLDSDEAKSASVKFLNKAESELNFTKLSPNMKIHALTIAKYSKDLAIECSQLVDDLIYTIEKKSLVVISKVPKAAKSLTNKAIESRQMQIAEKETMSEIQEKRRVKRKCEVNAEVNKWKEQKEYQKYLDCIEEQKKTQRLKEKELRTKGKKEVEKFELQEKLLKYKLERAEKELKSTAIKRDLSQGRNFLKKHRQVKSIDVSVPKSFHRSP